MLLPPEEAGANKRCEYGVMNLNTLKDILDKKINREHGLKRFFRPKRLPLVIIVVIILAGFSWAAFGFFEDKDGAGAVSPAALKKEVKTVILNEAGAAEIKTAGTSRADSKIDAVALTGGTIRNITFAVGDQVSAGQVLASLHDNTTLANLINAENNFANLSSNLTLNRSISGQTVRQAELGAETARQAIAAAEIAVKTTRDNLVNYDALKAKSDQDTKNNAVISFYGHLNTVWNVLGQVNYIIKYEGSIQLPGLENILGVKNLSSLDTAKEHYSLLKNKYSALSGRTPTSETIIKDMAELIDAMALAKGLVDDTIAVLDNTITSAEFPDSALTAQKSNFTGLRSTTVAAQSVAGSALQALQNLGLLKAQEKDVLANAVSAAESRLSSVNTEYNNALAGLENTRLSAQSQVLAAETALNSAQSQLNLARAAASDLTVRAPIGGVITKKYADAGTEANPGAKIAEISKTDLMKIEVDLASEDIDRIKLNQAVVIKSDLPGLISMIHPAADPMTRKVRVEIIFDNKDHKLIQDTFVDVTIPLLNPGDAAADSIYIPLKALTSTQTENYVFIVRDRKAQKTIVQPGKTAGVMVEISAGIKKGDELVVDGARNLEDGDELIIMNE